MLISDIDFPVWMIFAVSHEAAIAGQPVCHVDKTHGKCLAIFTDLDLAEQFVAAAFHHSPKPHSVKSISSLEVLNNVVRHFIREGCQHLAIDPPIGKEFENSQFIPAADFND